MPELPEIETVKRGLEPTLTGAEVLEVIVFRRDLRIPVPAKYPLWLQGVRITNLSRRAKYLCIHLENSKTAIFHLGMSGSITIGKCDEKPKKHDHIIWKLKSASGEKYKISFNDPRRFGFSDVIDTHPLNKHKYFNNLGAEPLSAQLNGKYIEQRLTNCKTNIKTWLMDGSKVAGIGNIYANEVLFKSKIHPLKPCNSLTSRKCEKLSKNIKKVLKIAIKCGDMSLKSDICNDQVLGYFNHNFQIYGKINEKCLHCSHKIIVIKISNRSSYFCPFCQPI